LKPTAIQVGKFSNLSVVVKKDRNDQYFTLNWEDLANRINNYEGDDLTFNKLKNSTIPTQSQTVEVMVGKIVDFLKDALSIILSVAELAALRANILTAFTDLKKTESHGWASWREEVDPPGSSWEYRLLYSVPMSGGDNKPDPNYIYTLVATITLTADISTKSEWWELSETTTQTFSASVNAIELIVEKVFINPQLG